MADTKITALTELTTPGASDVLPIVDLATTPTTKKITAQNLHANAIHDNVASEIHAITEKTVLANDDEFIIEDSADLYNKKRVKKSNLGGGFTTGVIQQVELYRGALTEAGIFDVSSISQGYDHLLIYLQVRSNVSGATDGFYVFFNNDTTTSNYWHQNNIARDGARLDPENSAPDLGPCPGNTADANVFGNFIMDLPLYTNGNEKVIFSRLFVPVVFGGTLYNGSVVAHWNNNSAINRITIQPDGYPTQNFMAGSFCQIIGIKTT